MNAVNLYIQSIRPLILEDPTLREEIKTLTANLPENLSKELSWHFGREKPIYANLALNHAELGACCLRNGQDFQDYCRIASECWQITQVNDPKLHWRNNARYIVSGRSARNFLERENPPFFYNRLSRLYSIRSLALAICNTNLQRLIEELAHNSIDAMQIATTTNQICNLIGSGWGFITTSHLLTDLGLSIKPDLHVQRSAHQLGLLPHKSSAQTTAIAVIDFSKRVASELSKDPRSTLREVDKVLMEWSRTFGCRIRKANTHE